MKRPKDMYSVRNIISLPEERKEWWCLPYPWATSHNHNEMSTASSTQAQCHCNLLDKEAVVRLGMEGKQERVYNQPHLLISKKIQWCPEQMKKWSIIIYKYKDNGFKNYKRWKPVNYFEGFVMLSVLWTDSSL